jgi:hypothetical protein
VRDRATAFYRSLAREAISAGEVQDGVTQDVLADLVLVLVTGLARHAALFDDNNRTRRVVEGVERLSLGNLLK